MWPMLFNYSVIDSDMNRKLPYYFIREAQKDFNLIVTRNTSSSPAVLYASNTTLTDKKASYTVEAYDENGLSTVILSGEVVCEKNSAKSIATLENLDTAKLLIIKWTEGDKLFSNHFLPGKISYDLLPLLLKIIAEAIGKAKNIRELNIKGLS